MMKYLLIAALLCLAIAAKAQPQIEFKSLVYDYGTIEEGADGNCKFYFKNIGNEPVIITNGQCSGGCVPTWPKELIKPGDSGVIRVNYNTERIGAFEKFATINSNTLQGRIVLKIKGQVHHKSTLIKFVETKINIGKLNFNETKSILFKFKNVGTEKLYLDEFKMRSDDIFEIKTTSVLEKDYYSRNTPSESALLFDTGFIKVTIHNYVGNTGNFERKIKVEGNFKEEIWLTVKGSFGGKTKNDTIEIAEDGTTYKRLHYTNGNLSNIKYYYNYNRNCFKERKYSHKKEWKMLEFGYYNDEKYNYQKTYINGIESKINFYE